MLNNKNQITKYDIIEFVRYIRTVLRVSIIISSCCTPIGLKWGYTYVLLFGTSLIATLFAIFYRKYTKGICVRLLLLAIANFLFCLSIVFDLEFTSKLLCCFSVVFGIYTACSFLTRKKTV